MIQLAKRTALLATVAGLVSFAALLPASAASAAPRPTARVAASCSSNEKQNGEEIYSVEKIRVYEGKNPIPEDTYIELWYSPTCRYVWAVEGGFATTDDHIWVYNEDTKQGEDAYYPSTSTAAIDDAGTESHACIENPDALPNNIPKTCTGYF